MTLAQTFATPRATILIPAYNEADVIGRTLANLTEGMQPDEFRMVIVPNACRDATADAAREACPQARIIETPVGGKAHAMNLGRNAAPDGILICVDADLTLTADDLRALIAPIEAGDAQAACGRMKVDVSGCSAAVRGFYGIWSRMPYARNGKFGGVIALSEDAAARVFPLPEVTADDEFINRSLSADEKAFAPDCCFTAHAPRDLASLIRVRRRVLRGNRKLTAMGLSQQAGTVGGSKGAILRQALFQPRLWVGLAVFALVGLAARAGLAVEGKPSAITWERDDSSRIAGAVLKTGMSS